MHAQHHYHVEHELLKWLILIAIALAFVFFATQPADGQRGTTQLLITATERAQTAQPPLALAASGSKPPCINAARNDTPTAGRMWQILDLHDTHDFDEAIDGWQNLSFYACDEPWRAIAVGTAYLQLGDPDSALCVLRESAVQANAVTYYQRGVVQWLNSRVATRQGKLDLAEEYRDFARTEFEKTLALASQIRLDARLGLAFTKFVSTRPFGPYETVSPARILPPTNPCVRDLLETLRLDDFVAKSHIAIAEIAWEHGAWEEVEHHLDVATEMGSDVGELYVMLGKTHAADGQSMSAARVFMKAMRGERKLGPAMNAIRNLRKASPLDSRR